MGSAARKVMGRLHDATFIIKRAFLSLSETSSCFTISHKTQPVGLSGQHPGSENKNRWQRNKLTFTVFMCVRGDDGHSFSCTEAIQRARKISSERCCGISRIGDRKAIFLGHPSLRVTGEITGFHFLLIRTWLLELLRVPP